MGLAQAGSAAAWLRRRRNKNRGFTCRQQCAKPSNVLTAVGLTAAVFFVIVVANAFLMARGSYATGFNLWYSFILRPDILGTMVLTAVVTFGYVWFGKGSGRHPRL